MVLRFEPSDGNRHARSLRDPRLPSLSFCVPELDRSTSGIPNASFGVAIVSHKTVSQTMNESSVV